MEDTQVYIIKPSFDRKLKWTTLYKGSKTDVSIREFSAPGVVGTRN